MPVPVLRTSRLTLRALAPSDTDAVVGLFGDPATSRYLADDLSDPAQARAMVERRLAYRRPDGLGHWVIERDGDGGPNVIGLAHLRPSDALPEGTAEIGYFLDPAHGGHGLATEAAAAVVAHGFAVAGLTAVWALVHESNVDSLKLARRLGFRDVGVEQHYGAPHRVHVALPARRGHLHHVELWVPDVPRAERTLGWLLTELGWREYQRWPHGVSWKLGASYVVVERSPALTAAGYDRRRPGLNHLALHAESERRVDELAAAAGKHGWRPLFADRYPHAGGAGHYAAYLENDDGFEVELVALRHGVTPTGE